MAIKAPMLVICLLFAVPFSVHPAAASSQEVCGPAKETNSVELYDTKVWYWEDEVGDTSVSGNTIVHLCRTGYNSDGDWYAFVVIKETVNVPSNLRLGGGWSQRTDVETMGGENDIIDADPEGERSPDSSGTIGFNIGVSGFTPTASLSWTQNYGSSEDYISVLNEGSTLRRDFLTYYDDHGAQSYATSYGLVTMQEDSGKHAWFSIDTRWNIQPDFFSCEGDFTPDCVGAEHPTVRIPSPSTGPVDPGPDPTEPSECPDPLADPLGWAGQCVLGMNGGPLGPDCDGKRFTGQGCTLGDDPHVQNILRLITDPVGYVDNMMDVDGRETPEPVKVPGVPPGLLEH